MKSISIYLTLCFIYFSSCSIVVVSEEEKSYRKVIIYMAADNGLSEDAWNNITEIQRVYKNKSVKLIVFIDSKDDLPHILLIEQGGAKLIKTYHEFNSADATYMKHIVMGIIEMYPAASYGLVLWSHGTSWLPAGVQLRSFGDDNGRQIDIWALAAALPVKFDFMLFDACLMGSVEVVYELRNKTDFIIASSTDIIYKGFPYEWVIPELTSVEPDLRKVASAHFDFYNGMQGELRSASVTLINTRELEKLATVTGQFITGRKFDLEFFDRTSVQRLDLYIEQYTFDFLDFLEKAFPEADTNPLKAQLGKTVLYKAHTPRFIEEYDILTYCGLSCYIPHPLRDDLNKSYQQLEWNRDSGFYNLFR